jgi:hypothetical protein
MDAVARANLSSITTIFGNAGIDISGSGLESLKFAGLFESGVDTSRLLEVFRSGVLTGNTAIQSALLESVKELPISGLDKIATLGRMKFIAKIPNASFGEILNSGFLGYAAFSLLGAGTPISIIAGVGFFGGKVLLARLSNADAASKAAFSFDKWLNDKTDSWVFIKCPAAKRAALRPILSLYLDTLVRKAMSLSIDKSRRIWLAIDELPSLQKLPSLYPALSEGRKYGLIGAIGVQTFPQLSEKYGADGAAILWGLLKTRLYLKIADKDTADRASAEIGEMHVLRVSESSGTSNSSGGGQQGGSSGTSTSVSTSHGIERAVLPSEIMALPDLTGYLLTGGAAVKVTISYEDLPASDQESFVKGTVRRITDIQASVEAS